jgi:hypothetical protein
MEVTLTWKIAEQVSPDDFATYTKVVHCKEDETLKELHERITKEWSNKNFNAEIHFTEK